MPPPYDKSKVTAVIPAKDEAEGLAKIILEVKKYAGEIIVVDGHSKDNTKQIVEKLGATYLLDNGKGRGAAVKLGIIKSNNEIIVLVDADGSHEISDIPLLVTPLLKKQADLVISSRRTGGSSDMRMNFDGLLRSAGSDLLVMLTNHKFDSHLTDILYSFRAVNKSKFRSAKLTSNGFSIEQEMVIKFLEKKYKIKEIPSREKARAWGESKLKTIGGIELFLKLIYDLYLR
ncbi:MAG: glycosyltransferase family 2 protein [Candidatus Levybacteria bacterium]|nr:glycosyltransferase family 2 protein [Candidatus Levybacteria bacterium]